MVKNKVLLEDIARKIRTVPPSQWNHNLRYAVHSGTAYTHKEGKYRYVIERYYWGWHTDYGGEAGFSYELRVLRRDAKVKSDEIILADDRDISRLSSIYAAIEKEEERRDQRKWEKDEEKEKKGQEKLLKSLQKRKG